MSRFSSRIFYILRLSRYFQKPCGQPVFYLFNRMKVGKLTNFNIMWWKMLVDNFLAEWWGGQKIPHTTIIHLSTQLSYLMRKKANKFVGKFFRPKTFLLGEVGKMPLPTRVSCLTSFNMIYLKISEFWDTFLLNSRV